MHEHYLAITVGDIYGYWGAGGTVDEAVKKMRKAGAKKRDAYRVYRFTSELPFAPSERKATAEEADCWIGRDGSCNWIRCDRELIQLSR